MNLLHVSPLTRFNTNYETDSSGLGHRSSINRIFTRGFRTLYARRKAFQLWFPMSNEEGVL
jgi:hypothetical protein